MGSVRIGDHTFELPNEDARELGQAAILSAKRGGFICPTPNLMIHVTPATNISVEIEGEFADMPTPKQILQKPHRGRAGGIVL